MAQTFGNNEDAPQPKRKPGRPKGSKNKNSKRKSFEDIANSTGENDTDWSGAQLHAPNGITGSNTPDLLQELLPILAKQEMENNRTVSEKEKSVKELLESCANYVSSGHRTSDREDNLKPFKAREEGVEICDSCKGSGMVVCDHCNGEGFVDLGKNGEKFNPVIGDCEVAMPKHVMGNIYHCPLCGGLQRERCVSCLGTGEKMSQPDNGTADSRPPSQSRAWEHFDSDRFLRENADRVEIGVDGTIIMRAKKRKKRSKKSKSPETVPVEVTGGVEGQELAPTTEYSVEDNEVESTSFGIGLDGLNDYLSKMFVDKNSVVEFPTKPVSVPDFSKGSGEARRSPQKKAELFAAAQRLRAARNRSMMRSTDFVNTTDYQMGQRLRKQNGSGSEIPRKTPDERKHKEKGPTNDKQAK